MNPIDRLPPFSESFPETSETVPKRQRLGGEPLETEPSHSSLALEQTLEIISELVQPILETSFKRAMKIMETGGEPTEATQLMMSAALELDPEALKLLGQVGIPQSLQQSSTSIRDLFTFVLTPLQSHATFYNDVRSFLSGKYAYLESSNIDTHICQVIASVLTKQREQFLADQMQEAFQYDFEKQPIPKLTLHIHDSTIGAFGKPIFELLANNFLITSLDLRDCFGFDALNVKNLCESLHDNTILKTLILYYINISDSGCPHLGTLLSTNSTLTKLKLKNNHIKHLGVEHLSEGLRKNTTLKHLRIQTNMLGADGIKPLCDVLEGNTTLKSLHLDSTDAGVTGTRHLHDLLIQNSSLTRLSLAYCTIENEGAWELGNALLRNSTLRVLDIRSNDIDDDEPGIHKIRDALRSVNLSLTTLRYRDNEIGWDMILNLDECTHNNRHRKVSLYSLLLAGDICTQALTVQAESNQH